MAKERLETLAEKDTLIYVYTRLFDFTEKLKAEDTETAVLQAVSESFRERGLNIPSKTLTFVPFRDTRQDQIVAPNKTKVIYEEDLKRLNKCVMLAGFLDGLTKDEGVCLEIGYAYGKGVPVVAVFTDFIQREYKGYPESTHITDPALMAMLSAIVRNYQVVKGREPFRERLNLSFNNALADLGNAVKEALAGQENKKEVAGTSVHDVYIDVGGGQFEWERMLQELLYSELSQQGYDVVVSKRNSDLQPLNDESVSTQERIIGLGKRDIRAASSSKVVVVCADMEEMSSGTAAIQGLARSLGKHVILLDTRTTDLVGDGGHRMSRNLMIDYAADVVARSYKDVPLLVKSIMDKGDKS